jgi:hypothetical protein
VRSFYLSLPNQDQFSIHIPYYTDVLHRYSYVRVIPDLSFVEGFVDAEYLKAFHKVSYPCYYIPIKKDNVHWVRCFNFEDIFRSDRVIVLVEGMKDAYIFLLNNIPAIAYLTSFPSQDLLDLLILMGKFIIFIPDNPVIDFAGKNAGDKFKEVMQFKKYQHYFVFNNYVGNIKDFGDWFLEEKREAAEKSFIFIKNFIRGIICD